ncbi:hypothetical protein XA68_10385 [Ophiocordyceps unilateralis]|uniref:Copper acquisition factor BIM1-like domain-containing protein n=1 Tax=Ophiocordyceps unilateralis TaxID=268505 RepID=A0A2A9PIB6_OPHUN|nr:hypothetical protein XA68_10385 [Ophiocordyceps unilateralis]
MRCSLENTLAVGLALLVTRTSAGHGDTQKSPNNPSTASVTDDTMGPASHLWPPTRKWTADTDNTPPCGSSAAVGFRTKFPMKGGKVSLVAQDDYYDVQISISYKKNPTENSDFTPLAVARKINDLNPGHTCVDVPDAPTDVVSPGTNATLQTIYRSNWDKPENQTFYVCSDITFVPAEGFKGRMMCFDATEPGEDDQNPPWIKKVDKKPLGQGPSDKAPAVESVSSSGSGSKLGSGAIAGISIGALAGSAVVAAIALLLYRRGQQKKRSQRIARMENARQDQGPMEKYSGGDNNA